MKQENRREFFRKNLSTLYLPYYDGIGDLLGEDWQPYYGIRTFQEQEALYKQGRERPGRVVTDAKAGESAHNYGCASDWCLWEGTKPIWPDKNSSLWLPYIYAIEKVGGASGSVFGDFPHNELPIHCSWRHVLIAFQQGGMTAAQQHIESNLLKNEA